MNTNDQGRIAPRRPIILTSPDFRASDIAETEAEYVVRANYAEAIAQAGGISLILPYQSQHIAMLVALGDGVLLTGTTPGHEALPERREFELELIRQTLQAGKPLLGICNGMQIMGEFLGGTFTTSLPDTAVDHIPADIPDRIAHRIAVEPGSMLASIAGTTEVSVNSLHRHALTGAGRFRIAARAPDGVVEAIEGETDTFCLGVQWHPEYHLSEFDRAIIRRFIEHSAGRKPQAGSPEACSVRSRLAALGLALPEVSVPPGAFVGALTTGDLVTVSGQVPLKDKAVLCEGHLGGAVSLDQGRECARWALLNALAQLELAAGGLDRVKGFVRLAGYVAATPEFTEHGAVIDGASELLRELFPTCWQHARIAIGVGSLPRGVPVEIELTAVTNGGEG